MFNVLIASGKIEPPRRLGGALASMVAHGALLTAIALGSRPAIRAATEFEQRIAEYLFPKDRAPKLGQEALSYLRTPGGGTDAPASVGGSGSALGRDEQTKPRDPLRLQIERPEGGTAGTPDAIAQQQKVAESLGAFALLDVDSGAVRDPRSAAPAYPNDMMAAGVEGSVIMRFVIDSTGLVDPATIKVLRGTNDSFVRAVLAAMPLMRFRPAMMGPLAVRQLAEQEFGFRLQKREATPAKKP